MVIVPLDSSCGLLEADVIEASKGGAANVFDRVVWNKKLLLRAQGKKVEVRPSSKHEERVMRVKLCTNLPPHEDVIAVVQRFIVKVIRVEASGIFVKRLKLALKKSSLNVH